MDNACSVAIDSGGYFRGCIACIFHVEADNTSGVHKSFLSALARYLFACEACLLFNDFEKSVGYCHIFFIFR